ncbi:MAG: hypothetical protein QXN86_02780 [Candidatus Methanomethylicaceae archaeon]
MSFQDRSEREMDEFKVELALLRRDLVERLRRIEEYITFLESDIGRIRLDLQRINDKISDFAGRDAGYAKTGSISTIPKPQETIKTEPIRIQAPVQPQNLIQEQQPTIAATPTPTTMQSPIPVQKASERKESLNQTEIAIIRYLIENPGTKSATPIAAAINKAREHIARTLKKLADEKKIIRDETTWPYSYVVPEEIKKMVLEETQPAQA